MEEISDKLTFDSKTFLCLPMTWLLVTPHKVLCKIVTVRCVGTEVPSYRSVRNVYLFSFFFG